MEYKFEQYRYYGDNASKNYPSNISFQELCNGALFENKAIYRLGIQTAPGVRFTLNQNSGYAGDSIYIGSTGIFELDLIGKAPICGLRFWASSLESLNLNNIDNYLIIDILYENLEGE